MTEHMLTTVDNPFNPFTHFDEWNAYDMSKGYGTSAFLARIVKTSDSLSEADQSLAIEDAIDEIVRENVLGLYRKIAAPEADSGSVSHQEVDDATLGEFLIEEQEEIIRNFGNTA